MYDQQSAKFAKLAALGVNVFTSSGDAGSNPTAGGHSRGSNLTAEFGASSPFVVAVGGTTLRMSGTGAVAGETGWTDSGGGNSSLYDRPTWQKGTGVPAGVHRLVPDVALVADGETGALVILNGQVAMYGGTSWSAPVWAGFSALLNESRTTAGKPRLGFLNPFLYSWSDADRAKAFRDITSGNNSGGWFNGQFYPCTAGYDRVTGLGVPNVKELRALTDAIGGALADPSLTFGQVDFSPEAWAKLKAKAPTLTGLKLTIDGDRVDGAVMK